MINTNVTNFRKNIYSMLEQTIKYNEPLNISTKNGNAVIMSEEDYRSLIATLELVNTPGMEEKIKDGLSTDLADCLSESEVEW